MYHGNYPSQFALILTVLISCSCYTCPGPNQTKVRLIENQGFLSLAFKVITWFPSSFFREFSGMLWTEFSLMSIDESLSDAEQEELKSIDTRTGLSDA